MEAALLPSIPNFFCITFLVAGPLKVSSESSFESVSESEAGGIGLGSLG